MSEGLPYRITETEWLQLLLDVMSLKERGAHHSESYVVENGATVRCTIWNSSAQAMVDKGSSRDEQLRYYKTWVQAARARVHQKASRLPGIGSSFDPVRNVIVEIAYGYGMGAYPICVFDGETVTWHPRVA